MKFSPKEAKGFSTLSNSGSLCQHGPSFFCPILAFSKKILHKSSNIFVTHAVYVNQYDTLQFSWNSGLIAVRLPLFGIAGSVITTSFINKHPYNQFDEGKQDWLVQAIRASATSQTLRGSGKVSFSRPRSRRMKKEALVGVCKVHPPGKYNTSGGSRGGGPVSPLF